MLNKDKAVFVYLADDQRDMVDKLAKARRLSLSATLRQIVDDYFKFTKKGTLYDN